MDLMAYALSKKYTDKSIAGTSGVLVGKSAYEIAVLNGFSGSESAWLESLKGSGINRTELISTVGLIKTYRIYYDDGSTYDYTVSDGVKGESGNDATINGQNSIEITEGENVKITKTPSGIEISATSGTAGYGMFAFEIVENDLIMLHEDGTQQPNVYIQGNDLIWEVE